MIGALAARLRRPGLALALACACTSLTLVRLAPDAPAATPPPQDPPAAKKAPKASNKAASKPATAPDGKASAPVAKAGSPKAAAIVDKFWDLPEQKKEWDLDHLTAEDEARLGADLDLMIRRYHPPLEEGPLPRRLENAAKPYLKSGSRKDLNYTLAVLDCEGSNAFSLPGGYIYVCKGLFDWIAEDEDYALEFIVAHEMAHVDLAHAITNLRGPDVKQLHMGTVPLFFFVAIPWGNKPDQEMEADRWANERMRKEGRSPYEIRSFLRKLEDHSKKHGFENYPRKPFDPPPVHPLDNHIRAHPVPYKRLDALKALLGPAEKH